MHSFPFDIVGFDLDGTLLDTKLDLGVALNHALAQAGHAPVSLDLIPRLVGGGTRVLMERALAAQGKVLEDAELTALAAQLVGYYEENIAVHSRLFPGGEAMLDELAARGVKLAVVTNKLEHLARKLFAALGLTERFYTIIGGDTLGPGRQKPKPDLLHLMVERSEMAAPRVAYVGDTHFDADAARAAGLPCVICSFGFNQGQVEYLGADAVIDHFDGLIPALKKL